jgi:hypothetical protein
MRVFVVTSAYCQAGLLAHGLKRFEAIKTPGLIYRHVVVGGHYPFPNKAHNEVCLRRICDAFGVEYMQPEYDLGSAQTQNWCLQQLDIQPGDAFINLDPDAMCSVRGWDKAMFDVLSSDPECALIHCISPPVQDMIDEGKTPIEIKHVSGYQLAVPLRPDQFNLTMWRYSVIHDFGGILQQHPYYGQVEIPMYMAIREKGFYNAYLLGFREDERGKDMHDPEFTMWKRAHAHDMTYMGKFEEYCQANGWIK